MVHLSTAEETTKVSWHGQLTTILR